MGERLLRREPHLAFAMAVEMILPLLGEELDRADVAVAALERVLDGEVIALALEDGGLAPELARRMGIGAGGETIAVEKRHPPVHRRIGGQPGFHREDAIGEIAVTVDDRVEAGLRSERREPRRPDMRRHQIGVGTGFERDLQEIAGIESENRSAVGGDVADTRQPCRHAIDGLEIGRIDQVMDFAGTVALLVDGRDFHLEHEPHRRAARRRQRLRHRLLDVVAQAVEAGLGGDQLLLELGAPGGMGEVAGGDDTDALAAGPCGEMLEIEIAAGRA